jgi:hypothetical protein
MTSNLKIDHDIFLHNYICIYFHNCIHSLQYHIRYIHLFWFLQEDFIAVEIVAQHIRFIWDVGGGAGEVEHPLKLEHGKSAEERNWYNVQIDR